MLFQNLSTAVSVAFGVTGTVVTFLSYFGPRRLRSRAAKLMVLGALLFGGLALIILELGADAASPPAAMQVSSSNNSPATQRSELPQHTEADALPLKQSSHAVRTPRQKIQTPAIPRRERTISVVDEQGQPVEDLVAAARNLDEALSLTARLNVRISDPDDQLQGLITTHATLHVSITHDGRLVDSFTLQSTGGGFAREASAQQAQDRLIWTLKQRLAQEHP